MWEIWEIWEMWEMWEIWEIWEIGEIWEMCGEVPGARCVRSAMCLRVANWTSKTPPG